MAQYLDSEGNIREDDAQVSCRECGHFMVLHLHTGCLATWGDNKCLCSYREVPCGPLSS